jgi:hypothetical protein
MAYNREGYAPWSLTRKAGVQSATVDGDIEVPQYIQPVLDTGFVDFKGDWKGRTSSDEQFIAFQKDEGIPNGGEILAPTGITGKAWPLDMTGFTDIQIAIRPTNGGNYAITAIMGPDDFSYANLRPVNPASNLVGLSIADTTSSQNQNMNNLFVDTAEALTANVWNIFLIQGRLGNQKLLQFKIVNNSGGESIIETAFMRLV